MMTSNAPNEAFVWVWLPNSIEPVVAGKLVRDQGSLLFAYGKSYLARDNAISIYEDELPLREGTIVPKYGLKLANCIRDSSPDAWGRRVIINRLVGQTGREVETAQIDELTYLLESGSDRIGGLDFQRSATEYTPRQANSSKLEELIESAQRIENGIPLNPELDQALLHGSSIGGARPKALLESENQKFIAKFSSSTDPYNIVKGEFLAMRLASLVGLNAACLTSITFPSVLPQLKIIPTVEPLPQQHSHLYLSNF